MAVTMEALLKLKADVTGEGAINSLATGLGKVQTAAGNTMGGFGKLTQSASGLLSGLGSLAPALTGAGLVAMAKGAIDAADNMRDMSQKTGVSVERLSQLKQAAEKSGTTLESVAGAMVKFNKGLADGKAAESLKELGISATDANGKLKPTDQLLLEVADKFKKMPDGAEKSALAMKLFGKSGADMIPMLNMGGDAIKALGVTMTTEFADKADNFNDKMVDMQTAFGKIGVAVGTALLPFLEKAADALLGLADGFGKLPAPVQQFIGGVAALAAGFVVLAPAINAIIGIVGGLGPLFAGLGPIIAGWAGAIGPLVAGVGSAFSGLLTILAGVFTGPVGWVALLAAAAAALWVFREPIGKFFTWIGEVFSGWIKSLWEWGEPIRQFWVGVWEKVKEVATTFGTWFLQALYDWIVKPWVDLVNYFAPAAMALWESVKGVISGFFTWFGEVLYKLYVEPWVKIGEAIANAAVALWNAVKNAVSGFFTWFMETVKTYLVEPVSTALSAVGKFFADAWSAVQKLLGDVFNWYVESVKKYLVEPVSTALSGIGKFFSEAWGAVKTFLVGWFSWWGEFFYKALIEPIQLGVTKLGELFSAVFDKIKDIGTKVWNAIVNAWNTAVKAITDAMSSLATAFSNNVVKPIQTAWDGLIKALGNLANQLGSTLKSAWDGISNLFKSVVIDPIKTAWDGLSKALGDAMKVAVDAIGNVWDGIKGKLSDAFKAIGQAFTDYVVAPLKNAWEGISKTISDSLNGAVNAVKKAYESIAGAVTGAFKGVIGTVGNIINSVINALNKLIEGVNKVRNAVGLSSFSLIPNVSIPSYAQGGVAKKPTLAMVGDGGEPEYLIPQSKMAAAAMNYLQGARGESVLNASALRGSGIANPVVTVGGGETTVTVTTGPVQQINGEQYVTLDDLQKAVSATARQVQDQILRNLSQPSTRQRLGMA